MKVISIVQPWATLVALGEKKFETRSWNTKYRGQLAIHASKIPNKTICNYEPFLSILGGHGYTAENLPTGVILAACRLADSLKVIETKSMSAILDDGQEVTGKELLFGDFSEGRFAWLVQDAEMLAEFVPAKGKLGLWEWQTP